MWRLCRLGYTHEPRLVVFAVILTLCQAIPDALFALWLKVLADALEASNSRLVFAMLAAMAVSATLTWLLQVLSTRMTRRFRDRVTIALETHVATLQASVPGLELQERPDYLDRLAVLRNQVFVLDHMYMSVLDTIGLDRPRDAHDRSVEQHQPAARAAGCVRHPDRGQLGLATGG